MEMPHRPRRNRRSETIRAMVRETTVTPADFIWPLFVHAGADEKVIDADFEVKD